MPPTSDADDRSAKLKLSFQNLSAASTLLNAASDAFGEAIAELDQAINRLNPGVSAWVTVTRFTPDQGRPWEIREERLGYEKLKGRWGLTLAELIVDGSNGEDGAVEAWLFNDAPRSLRLRAVKHIPDLIEALAKEAATVAKRVSNQANYATELTKTIVDHASRKDGQR